MANTFVEPESGFPEWPEYTPVEEDPDDLSAVIAMAEGEVRSATEQLGTGKIAVPEWIDLMVEVLTIHHLAAWMSGSGNLEPSDTELERLIDFIADEINYLARMQEDLLDEDDGIELPGEYRRRADLYARAVRVSYFDGVAAFYGISLPVYPGERSRCLRNCNCTWVIEEVDASLGNYNATWILGIADHCPQCEQRALGFNPLRITAGLYDGTQVVADMFV